MTESEARDLQLIEGDAGASAVLHPLRRQILRMLRHPDSATGLSRSLGIPRQKLNYHLRELEKQTLVELVEEKRKGNCVERVVRATARAYLISPATLGQLSADPERIRDRFSVSYLLALASRIVRDLGTLRTRAARAGKRIATFSLTTDVRFASPARRQAFAEELTEAVAGLVARYHDEEAPAGRTFRFVVGGYPAPRGGRTGGPSDPDPNPRKPQQDDQQSEPAASDSRR